MAAEGEIVATPGFANFASSSIGRKLFLMVGIAAVIAVMAGVWMWSQKPDYRVLFSNFSDKDGGSIVAALEQMNVQYKYAEGGSAILVPADQVHDLRLKLASQGLPKGGNVGFELMENQKLGTSQFLEQVNFQRAIEGELAQTIEAVNAVQSARVHLALPKVSVFVRDQQKPTASILLNLQPGRALDVGQVSAIVHLVASSVPDLTPSNVTIVDQNGNLLSDNNNKLAANGMDPNQLKYVQALQDDVAKRIESIVAPIVGAANIHAEVTADVDFSHSEQAAESYKPNQTPDSSTVRSTQTSESINGGANASGIPGAATNQPPAPATAPITAPPAAAGAPAVSTTATPTTTQKDATTNYEVDKTIRYVQQPMGGLKRLSVAVVVNYKQTTDKTGKIKNVPLTAAEQAQISDLVKEAMGYNQARGDTLNVLNSQFVVNKETIPETPIWKQPENINLVKEMGKYLLAFIAIFFLYKKVLKPLIEKFSQPHRHHTNEQGEEVDDDEDGSEVHLSRAAHAPPPGSSYQSHLNNAKQMAKENPKVVASVVKVWVNGNE